MKSPRQQKGNSWNWSSRWRPAKAWCGEVVLGRMRLKWLLDGLMILMMICCLISESLGSGHQQVESHRAVCPGWIQATPSVAKPMYSGRRHHRLWLWSGRVFQVIMVKMVHHSRWSLNIIKL
jgi:hypothetical protein